MTDLVLTTDGERAFTPGKFYWVLAHVSPADPVTERPIDNDDAPTWQPARYTGKAADSVGLTWDFIGYRSEDGHHFVDVIQVGSEITYDIDGQVL